MNAHQISWLPEEVRNHIAQLERDLDRVTAERDHWIALYKDRNKTAAILEDTSIALRARVAELEKEAMILRGTVEAVTTQRQQAEQRNTELVAVLEKIAKSDPLANGRYAAHNAAQALARAESDTPAKHGGSAH